MRQRLGLARALVNDPAVVFLDEPTLGLDPSGQHHVLDLVTDIAARRGATVVLSTHLLADVEAVCGRVVILNKGRIVADGRVDEVLSGAAANRSGRLRVPVHLVERAVSSLRGVPGLEVTAVDHGIGLLALLH